MLGDARVLALIPARAGSKGLPHKNLRHVAGSPLIAWTIRAAMQSRFVDRVVVSTDGPEIVEVARSLGADVPFLRPAELAGDESSMQDVVRHCMDHIEREGDCYDLLVLLQPTSPLRVSEDLDSALALVVERQAEAIVSVCRAEHSPLWSGVLPENGDMSCFQRPEIVSAQRQSLPDYYRVNGAVYVARWPRLRDGGWFFGSGSFAYVMPRRRSIDVDSLLDLELADCLLRKPGASR